ncbi:MAG: response regulator transcription factor [Thermoleophilaceae bacterium]
MRILLVEDEPKMADVIARGLRQEGYAVDTAATGDEALFQARVYDYDAIVLDLLLPGPDGLEVCRTLRDEGRWAPVLMLTALDQVGDRVSGLDAGADDYLVKPFSFGELLARVRALLRRRPRERPAVLRAAGVELDPAKHTVTRAGQPVQLTAREFSLLRFMMEHPTEVLTRTSMLEHVWDANYDGPSNVVDVYVGYLRKKLEAPFERPLIRTVRGVGYTLEAE